MKNISLNLRGKLEPQVLQLLRGAARVAAEQRVPFFVVGASARDMLLEHGFGVRSTRATTDIDLAIAIGDWAAYGRFFSALTQSDVLKPVTGIAHRYELVRSSLTVDIVPFGEIEKPVGVIAWPPRFETTMTVTGFRDALACAWTAELDADLAVRVASLHGLAFLKILAWRERNRETQRDGVDLDFIIRQYGSPVMQERLKGESLHVWEREDFDTLAAGARLLGNDMAGAMSENTKALVCETLEHESRDESGLRLVQIMAGRGADDDMIDRAIAQLRRVREGIDEAWNSSGAG
ncbi:MAG: nucleotidyl transferase AbiEii/AbiGii toxin family protein [Usitatibacteraceae bacterium]